MAANEDSRLLAIDPALNGTTPKPRPRLSQEERVARIAALNDALRRTGEGGRMAITPGVAALGDGALPLILRQVCLFDAFTPDNDPYGERDFGAFEHGGARLFWKIDYYDHQLRQGSPNPADPAVTARVLTILLASEW